MKYGFLYALFLALLINCSRPPVLELPPIPFNLGFRGGVSTADGDLILAGEGGKVMLLKQGSSSWRSLGLPTWDSLEFRDVVFLEASKHILVMAIGSPGYILRYHLGTQVWDTVYTNPNPDFFLDGLLVHSNGNVFAYGDPVDSSWTLLQGTSDGKHWEPIDLNIRPSEGEAGFAASGTGIVEFGPDIAFASGGKSSGIYVVQPSTGDTYFRPVMNDTAPSSGIFSMIYLEELNRFVAVGGDYLQPESREENIALLDTAGFVSVQTPPFGYRSCIIRHNNILFTSGRNGTDFSTDFGVNWQPFSQQGFYRLISLKDGFVGIGKSGVIRKFGALEIKEKMGFKE